MIAKKLLTTIAFALVLLFSGCAKDDLNEIDGVCPLVVSTVPEDGDFDIPLNQIITATFNEKMNPATITGASFTVGANSALIDGTVSYTDSTAVFTPSSLLDEDTEYTGTITTLAKDKRGNALQEDYVWTFTTINQYTVTFNKNGGTTEASPTSKTATSGGNVGSLPAEPTRTGYTFDSWNTAADGSGTAFTATTAVTADVTVYAQWTAIPPIACTPAVDLGSAGDYAILAETGISSEIGTPTTHA